MRATVRRLALALAAALSPACAQAEMPVGFAGWYAGLGGSYGLAEQRNFNMSANAGISSGTGFFDTASPDGWSGSAVAGRNLIYGNVLLGLEASGRWGDEGFSRTATMFLSSLNNLGNEVRSATLAGTYKFNNDAGAHVGVRLGFAFDNTLIFAKAGFGAAHLSEGVFLEGSGDVCSATIFSGAPLFRSLCVSRLPVGSGQMAKDWWLPSVVFGVGVEQNFGNWFVRAGADAEAIMGGQRTAGLSGLLVPSGGSFFGSSGVITNNAIDHVWTVRANALIGLRF